MEEDTMYDNSQMTRGRKKKNKTSQRKAKARPPVKIRKPKAMNKTAKEIQ